MKFVIDILNFFAAIVNILKDTPAVIIIHDFIAKLTFKKFLFILGFSVVIILLILLVVNAIIDAHITKPIDIRKGNDSSSSVDVTIYASVPGAEVNIRYEPKGFEDESKHIKKKIENILEIDDMIPDCEYIFNIDNAFSWRFPPKYFRFSGDNLRANYITEEAKKYDDIYYDSFLSFIYFSNGVKVNDSQFERLYLKYGEKTDIYVHLNNLTEIDDGKLLCTLKKINDDGSKTIVAIGRKSIKSSETYLLNVKAISNFKPEVKNYIISLYLKPDRGPRYGLVYATRLTVEGGK